MRATTETGRCARAFAALLLACAALPACEGAGAGAAAPPAIGSEIGFAGTVSSSEVMLGGHRFTAGPQGVWFRLESEPGARFHYLLPSIEVGRANGVLRADADGEVRFADLAGRRVEGRARVRGPAARDVLELRVLDAAAASEPR